MARWILVCLPHGHSQPVTKTVELSQWGHALSAAARMQAQHAVPVRFSCLDEDDALRFEVCSHDDEPAPVADSLLSLENATLALEQSVQSQSDDGTVDAPDGARFDDVLRRLQALVAYGARS